MSMFQTLQPGLWRRWIVYLLGMVIIALLFFILALPIAEMLIGAFLPNKRAFSFSNLSLVNFQRFLTATNYKAALSNSLIISLSSAAIATLLAIPAAFALSRIRIPLAGVIMALFVVPLVAPPFVGAYAWIILLGKNGIVTHILQSAFGVTLPSIYGHFGVILALSLSLVPYVVLIAQGALAAGDPRIEESAHVMGASRAHIFRTVTLPLMTPAISAAMLIVFIKALGNFGVPAILGGEIYVLPTLIYFQVHGFFNLNAAAAIAIIDLIIAGMALWILALVNRKNRFVTVTGSARRTERIEGFNARFFGNLYVWILLVATLLPQAVVVWTSFSEHWAGTLLPTAYGMANYFRIYDGLLQPFANSAILAISATIITILVTLSAYALMRAAPAFRWAIESMILLPFVVSGVVTGVAFLVAFNAPPIILTGTAAILILAYVTRRIAFVFRTVSASLAQIDPRIEEASLICGAGIIGTIRRVTIPLVAPGILSGAIIVLVTLITEMSVTILLYSARWKTISIAIYERLLNDDLPAAAAIGTVTIVFTMILVYGAGKLAGRTMAEMFR